MNINSISDLLQPTLPPLVDVTYILANEAWYKHYDDCQELSEAHHFSKLILPPREDMAGYEKYAVNIFAYHYTHGRILKLKGLPAVSKPAEEWDSLEYDYKYRVPKQQDRLNKMWAQYTQPDIIASLLAFDIDPVKFWFALLWLAHYIDDKVEDTRKPYESPTNELLWLYNAISDENQTYNSPLNFGDIPTFQMTLTTHRDKVTISNPYIIQTISNLLYEHLEKVVKESNIDISIQSEEDSKRVIELMDNLLKEATKDTGSNVQYRCDEPYEKVNPKERIYLFSKYMKIYLKDKQGTPRKLVRDFIIDSTDIRKVSIDKNWLISRLLCVVGFGDAKQYYDIEHMDYLKTTLHNNKLKKCEKRVSYLYEDFEKG